MKALAKWLLFEYERFVWYVGIFIGEIDKPLTVFKYVSYGAILLKLFGANISLDGIIILGFVCMVLAWIGGMILVKTDVVAYVQKLNNSQNPELLAIHKQVNNRQAKIIDLPKVDGLTAEIDTNA